ncbi:MAG: tetratricopeptide repeat protein [Methylotenera sp.]|nr:tetratricopeptide repeat protein [Methylotenera sp.]MDP2281032.1 tetratricopeptide repeat protein [Methylotenera sp.]MDP3060146.1 tetratricopeptide repeat protein [Methylotenera sp.]
MMFWILAGLMSLLALAFVLIPMVKPSIGHKPLLMVGLLIGIPLAAVLIYQKLGVPTAAIQPALLPMQEATPEGHPDVNIMNMDFAKMADGLAQKLKANPDNADGWILLARTYVKLQRYEEALQAFERASALRPKAPQLMADYADALATSNQGQFDQKSEDLVNQALVIDPAHAKALMLKGTIDFVRQDYQQAIASWEKLLAVPELDAESAEQMRGSIAEAKHRIRAAK